jgi:hypothetical protein
MDDDERDAAMETLAEGLRQAQAQNLANSYVLREIVRDLAAAAGNRHGFLADMFARISARADRLPIEGQSNAAIVSGLFRQEVAKFFAEVASNALAPEDGDPAPARKAMRGRR